MNVYQFHLAPVAAGTLIAVFLGLYCVYRRYFRRKQSEERRAREIQLLKRLDQVLEISK